MLLRLSVIAFILASENFMNDFCKRADLVAIYALQKKVIPNTTIPDMKDHPK